MMYTPKLIYGDKQLEAVASCREMASLLINLEKRINDPPEDVKHIFDALHLNNANLAYRVGGPDLMEELYMKSQKR